MADQQKFIRNKPHLNIGTIGHVDHGKPRLRLPLPTSLRSLGLQRHSNTKISITHRRKKPGALLSIFIIPSTKQ